MSSGVTVAGACHRGGLGWLSVSVMFLHTPVVRPSFPCAGLGTYHVPTAAIIGNMSKPTLVSGGAVDDGAGEVWQPGLLRFRCGGRRLCCLRCVDVWSSVLSLLAVPRNGHSRAVSPPPFGARCSEVVTFFHEFGHICHAVRCSGWCC